MRVDARLLLPLKPLVFEILLSLEAGERHGWSLVRDIQQQSSMRVLPANFYRTLRTMLADGLIEETDAPKRERATPAETLERRRYFGLTTLGREAARLEARRLQDLVRDGRTRRLLNSRKP